MHDDVVSHLHNITASKVHSLHITCMIDVFCKARKHTDLLFA